jgi:hypothetical protein
VAKQLVASKWNTHEDEVLGIVRTRLPTDTKEDEVRSCIS